jgi:hypothetical protein
MNTYFQSLLQPERKRRKLKLPFFFGKLEIGDHVYGLFSIKVSIYEIDVECDFRDKEELAWITTFDDNWKNQCLVHVEVNEYYHKNDLNERLSRCSFKGQNSLSRLTDSIILHLFSFFFPFH